MLSHLINRGPLNRADRRLWAQARTLNDLGELTAQWLEGRIASQPGYYGPVDVDERDAPGLTTALVACCRAGFVTRSSQAGWDGPGADGAHWQQISAVDGIASEHTASRISATIPRPYKVLIQPIRRRAGKHVPATWREGRECTGFGGISRRDALLGFSGCSGEALAEVEAAWDVVVYDPEPGRNTLWEVLEHAARRWRS